MKLNLPSILPAFLFLTASQFFLPKTAEANDVLLCDRCTVSDMQRKAKLERNGSYHVVDPTNGVIKKYWVETEDAEGFNFTLVRERVPDQDKQATFNAAMQAKQDIKDITEVEHQIPASVLGNIYDLTSQPYNQNAVQDWIQHNTGLDNAFNAYISHWGTLISGFFGLTADVSPHMLIRTVDGGQILVEIVGSNNHMELVVEVVSAQDSNENDVPMTESNFSESKNFKVSGSNIGGFNEAATNSNVRVINFPSSLSGSGSSAVYAVSCSTTSDGTTTCTYRRII